ncbi:MAG: hypothetical protein ABSC23_03245 [Bryobacteraceae bacterium]
MKTFHWTCTCLLAGALLTAVATIANADSWDKRTIVTTNAPIEVPGAILPAGQYIFKLANSFGDRHIVQITSADENYVYATDLANSVERANPSDKTILTFYEMPGNDPEPVRSWFYPGDTVGQQFTYSKQRAMEIAQAMEHGPALAELTRPEAAEPSETPGPAAEAVPAPETDTSSAAAMTPSTDDATTASEPVPNPSLDVASAEPAPAEPSPEEPAAQQPSTEETTPAEPDMPKTAGNTTVFGLLGLCCLGAAIPIRRALRRAGNR